MKRKLLLLFFVVVPLTALVVGSLVCLFFLYQEEQQKDTWIETSGTITRVENHDVLTPITTGRKWRRRTELLKQTILVRRYEYRDNYGYKQEGCETTPTTPAPDWRNKRIVIVDRRHFDRNVKVYYNPLKTCESRLHGAGKELGYLIICALVTLGIALADVAVIRLIVKK